MLKYHMLQSEICFFDNPTAWHYMSSDAKLKDFSVWQQVSGSSVLSLCCEFYDDRHDICYVIIYS